MDLHFEYARLYMTMGCQSVGDILIPSTDVFYPFSPILIPMDDYGYWDYLNDTCFIMDDFGCAVQTPWIDWPESYYENITPVRS